jgi:hypothetical protein
MQTGSSGTLIGWKSGQTTFVPLWDRMEGAWLRTQLREQICQTSKSDQQEWQSVVVLNGPNIFLTETNISFLKFICGILNRGMANSFWNHVIQTSTRQMYFQDIYSNLWKVKIFSGKINSLKVFSNEKRGGLRVISFDRPPFKLLSRKFSKDSVQAPSCERHKPLSEHLFILFANNYWFPTSDE